MIISFFEEFPAPSNLPKLNLVSWPTKLYLAAKSLEEFERIATKIKNKKVKKIIYWPVLEKKEGYWISPWASTAALDLLFSSLLDRKNKKSLSVMLDLEPPQERIQLLTRFPVMFANKKKIKHFLLHAPQKKIKVYTAELSHLSRRWLRILGLSYPHNKYNHQRIGMYYTSFFRQFLPQSMVEEIFTRQVERLAQEKMFLGMGLIAPGVHRNEPIYNAKALNAELKIAQEKGIKEVIIFRLGGLNEKYAKVIEKFI